MRGQHKEELEEVTSLLTLVNIAGVRRHDICELRSETPVLQQRICGRS